MERLLTAGEAADVLRVTKNRLYELAKKGAVPCVKLGHRVRFSEDELLAWIHNGGTKEDVESVS